MAQELHLLDTIQVVLNVLDAQTTVMTEQGPYTQSIWNANEEQQIKNQLKGLLKQIPDPKYFSRNAE